MKQKFLLLVFSFAFFGLQAQDVAEQQTPLISKVTATWCPNCGTWGWTFFENIIQDNGDKAIMLGVHDSGDLQSAEGVALSNNFNAIGQPKFFVNDEDLRVNSSSISAKRTEVENLVNTMIAESPVANVGFYAEMGNGQINVRTKTKFFQDGGANDYNLALYLIEDDVVNNQSGQGVTMHPNVIRTGFTADAFGEILDASGTIASGTEIIRDFSLDVNPNWEMANVSVVAVIWENNGGNYQFVNASRTNDFSGIPVSSVVGISQVEGFAVTPTIVTETATVEINLTETLENAALTIFDLTGKKVATVFAGNLNSGIQTFEINRSVFAASGMYFLTLENNGKVMTQKVIVK